MPFDATPALGASDIENDDVMRVLRETRRILEEPGRWSQGSGARDRSGASCDITSSEARSYCLMGALQRAALSIFDGESSLLFTKIYQGTMDALRFRASMAVMKWNDHTPLLSQDDVIDRLDAAIVRRQAFLQEATNAV